MDCSLCACNLSKHEYLLIQPQGTLSLQQQRITRMLIKLPVNVHFGQLQVLAVNLNAFERIIIHKISSNEFQLALDSIIPVEPNVPITDDPATQRIVINTYNTYEEASTAFQSMITAFQNGSVVWSPE